MCNSPNELRARRQELRAKLKPIEERAKQGKANRQDEETSKAILAEIESIDASLRTMTNILAAEPPTDDERSERTTRSGIGMTGREVRRYSFDRAIAAAASGNWRDAGFEGEISQEVSRRTGRDYSRPGMFGVPWDVIVVSLRSKAHRLLKERRDLTVATEGADVVATMLDAQNFIDVLRNLSVAAAAGADLSYTALVGDVQITRATAGTNVAWVAESGAASESTPTFDNVSLTPSTCSAWLDFSRRFKLQSSVNADNYALNTLTADILTEVDRVFFFGSGSGNEPAGVASTAGIGSVAGGTNGAAPVYDHLIDLEGEVAVDNADVSTMSFVTNTKVRAKLKKTPLVSSTDSRLIWEAGQKELAGYPAHVTNGIPSNLTKGTAEDICSAILFGCWDQAILATWGDGLDILVDPFSQSTAGITRVVAFMDVAVAVKRAQSFAAMLDALTS